MPALPIDPMFTAIALRSQAIIRDGVAVTNSEGIPLVTVTVTTDPNAPERLELVPVKVPVTAVPNPLPFGTPVRFESLTVRPWERDGRAGVTFNALRVISVTTPQQAKPAAPAPSSASSQAA